MFAKLALLTDNAGIILDCLNIYWAISGQSDLGQTWNARKLFTNHGPVVVRHWHVTVAHDRITNAWPILTLIYWAIIWNKNWSSFGSAKNIYQYRPNCGKILACHNGMAQDNQCWANTGINILGHCLKLKMVLPWISSGRWSLAGHISARNGPLMEGPSLLNLQWSKI